MYVCVVDITAELDHKLHILDILQLADHSSSVIMSDPGLNGWKSSVCTTADDYQHYY